MVTLMSRPFARKNSARGISWLTESLSDPETVTALREILDDAWARLPPEKQATLQKTALAERILKLAAEGERNRRRLLDAALTDLAA